MKELSKFKKDSLRIDQKQIQTRMNRQGAIRNINELPAAKDVTKKNLNALGNSSTDDLRENANKQKLNIFDAQDSNILKHETLANLGYEERARVPVDEQSQVSSVRSSQRSTIQKPKAIEYLNKGRQQKESVRDFVDNARKILMAQISIIDKTEETELLEEYIIMEQEKLHEGMKTFNEDKDIYEKVKLDLQTKSQAIEESVRQIQKENEKLLEKINQLKKDEAELIS